MNRASLLLIASFLSTAYSFGIGSKSIGLFSSGNTIQQQWYQSNQIQSIFSKQINSSSRQHVHQDFEVYDVQQQQQQQRVLPTTITIKQEWIQNSMQYYSKVMREERRKSIGQYNVENTNPGVYTVLAKKHYFALKKIKDGKPDHAECIYRRIINELVNDIRHQQQQQAEVESSNSDGHEHHHHCDHSTLAITTLLLALHLQRNDASPKKTRSVFLNFFKIVTSDHNNNNNNNNSDNTAHEECACSAKVLQAFALFEMKQGNALKSLELAKTAIKLDPTLQSVLNWKQFRIAIARRMERSNQQQQQQKELQS